MKTIACIVGARPNFMKIAPILAEMARRPNFKGRLIHTGQHFSPEMSDAFFAELQIPRPNVSLGISGGSSNQQTARIMQALEPVFEAEKPDLVLVVGDVNSTIAAALVAAKAEIPIAHVEAGLRSFDRSMPEEINRIVTDSLSNYLFTTEPAGNENLLREGVSQDRIFFCGNVMIDTLLRFKEQAMQSDILERLRLPAKAYAVATLHRPSNVDEIVKLTELIQMLDDLAADLPVVFPIHPRTRGKLDEHQISAGKVILTPPLGYLDFLKLMSEARLVLTDSGGIQEETTILNVPCLTVRENTERPVTIREGTNQLAGIQPSVVLAAARKSLSSTPGNGRRPHLWDGKAAVRILDTLEKVL